MAGETKERILNTALALFSQRGYLGTSMSDIANELGMTKGALYKHYNSKQEILDRITARMGELDRERAQAYQMPDAEPDGFAEAYRNTPAEKIRTYSIAQFRHWTEDGFSARFRKLLTLEQYRDPAFAALYQNYLASGPVAYMAEIFRTMTDSNESAMQLALEFYGPIYLLYSIYDGTEDKEAVIQQLQTHIDCFIQRMEQSQLLLRRSAGRTGQNHPARHRRQLRPWPVPAGQRAHADRLCGGGADPDRRHRHTHRQIPGAAGGLVLSRLCGRHAEDPDRRNLPAPHPLILNYASCASSHWGSWAMLSNTSSAPARKKTALAFSLAASRSAGGRASYSAWV